MNETLLEIWPPEIGTTENDWVFSFKFYEEFTINRTGQIEIFINPYLFENSID